jgi:hypothetical protein
MTTETKTPAPETEAPPVVAPLGVPGVIDTRGQNSGAGNTATGGIHKNAAVGPTTNKLLTEWRRSRDYEQFNPTPEK